MFSFIVFDKINYLCYFSKLKFLIKIPAMRHVIPSFSNQNKEEIVMIKNSDI